MARHHAMSRDRPTRPSVRSAMSVLVLYKASKANVKAHGQWCELYVWLIFCGIISTSWATSHDVSPCTALGRSRIGPPTPATHRQFTGRVGASNTCRNLTCVRNCVRKIQLTVIVYITPRKNILCLRKLTVKHCFLSSSLLRYISLFAIINLILLS